MQCELCGRESSECKLASVDNVKMMVCPTCLRHGKAVRIPSSESRGPADVSKGMAKRAKQRKKKDVYEKMTTVLVDDWNQKVQQARQKMGWSREDLGFRVGEPTVTMAKIENGDLRPSDEVIKKLEKELDISLMEEVKETVKSSQGSNTRQGLTIGDLLKTEKEK